MLQKLQIKLNKCSGIVGFILGVICFLCIFGFAPLDVTNLDWIHNGYMDLRQHQLGWEHFRASAWSFPLGLIDNIIYPYQISVVYIDAVPLFAIVFKIFDGILPQTFTYLGIFEILCFGLQGLFAEKIAAKYTSQKWKQLCFALLMVLSPILLHKAFYHTALSAHWLVLAAWYLWLNYRDWTRKKLFLYFFLLSVLALGIEAYFIPMVMLIMLGCYLEIAITEHSWWKTGAAYAINVGILLCIMYILGFFYGGVSGSDHGLGMYCFNLLGLFDPDYGDGSISSLLPSIKYCNSDAKWEGFAYLGLGGIFLLFCLLLFVCKQKGKVLQTPRRWLMALICIAFVILAVSPNVQVGNHVAFDYSGILPNIIFNVWSAFRSSGRLIWPVFYLIFIAAFKVICTIKKEKLQAGIIILCLVLQIFDLIPLFQVKKQAVNTNSYESSLQSDFWEDAAVGKKHVMYLDTALVIFANTVGFDFEEYALQHQMTMNTAYLSRSSIISTTDSYKNELVAEYMAGDPVFDDYILIAIYNDPPQGLDLCYYRVDGYVVGLTQPLKQYEDLRIYYPWQQ